MHTPPCTTPSTTVQATLRELHLSQLETESIEAAASSAQPVPDGAVKVLQLSLRQVRAGL